MVHSKVGKIPMQSELERAIEESNDLDKKIIELGEFNILAHGDLILLINTDPSFGLV